MKTEFTKGSFIRRIDFEKRNAWIYKVKSSILRAAGRYHDIQRTINDLRDYLTSEFKIGSGSSHIWVCNEKDERILIIYF